MKNFSQSASKLHLQTSPSERFIGLAMSTVTPCLEPWRRFFGSTFYGYAILAAAVLGILAGSSGHSFMVGVYTDSFMEDLSLSRSSVSAIWTVTLISSSLYVQFVGRLVDRAGAPFVFRMAVIPYFLALALLSQAYDTLSLVVGYLAVRMLGPETLDFCARNCLNQWWVQRRGFAFGVLNSVGALMVAIPALTSQLKRVVGWRATLLGVAVVQTAFASVAALVLLRRPEDHGMAPDGGATQVGTVELASVQLRAAGMLA